MQPVQESRFEIRVFRTDCGNVLPIVGSCIERELLMNLIETVGIRRAIEIRSVQLDGKFLKC